MTGATPEMLAEILRSHGYKVRPPEYRECEECGQPFVLRDRRMRFCSKTHSHRARQRRYKHAHA